MRPKERRRKEEVHFDGPPHVAAAAAVKVNKSQ